MDHFQRIRNCSGFCGGLRGGIIAIGVLYLLTTLYGAPLDDMIYPGLTTGSPYISYSKLGPCAEKPFLPMWKFCSLVSVFINLIMVYGALTEQSLPVVPWIVWHIAMPLVQFSVFKWNNIKLATCQGIISSDGSGIAIIILFSYIIGSLFASLLSFIANFLFILFILYGLYRLFRRRTHRGTMTVNEQHVFHVQRRYRIRVYGL